MTRYPRTFALTLSKMYLYLENRIFFGQFHCLIYICFLISNISIKFSFIYHCVFLIPYLLLFGWQFCVQITILLNNLTWDFYQQTPIFLSSTLLRFQANMMLYFEGTYKTWKLQNFHFVNFPYRWGGCGHISYIFRPSHLCIIDYNPKLLEMTDIITVIYMALFHVDQSANTIQYLFWK